MPVITPEAAPDRGAQALADRLSEQVGEAVRAIDPSWGRYAQQGLLVDLHVRRERFRLQMTLEGLGIAIESKRQREAVRKALAPGHLYLIPRETVRRAELLDEQIRANLRRLGYKTFWGSWVHLQAWEKWQAEHAALVAKFDALVEEIIATYPDLIKAASAGWVGLAISNHRRLQGTAVALADPDFADRDAWVRKQLREIRKSLPTPEKIRRSFGVSHEVWLIPTQEMVAADAIKAGDLRLDAARSAMLAELERSAKGQARAGLDQLMTDVRARVQGQVFDAVAGALKVVRGRNGKLGRNSSKALSDLLVAIQDLVFWDESGTFQANVAALERILGTAPAKRDGAELEAVLAGLGAEARLVLMDLDAGRARLGVVVDPEDPEATLLGTYSQKGAELAAELGFDADEDRLVAMVRRAVAPSADDDDDLDEADVAPAAVRRAAADPQEDPFEDDLLAETSPSRQPVAVG